MTDYPEGTVMDSLFILGYVVAFLLGLGAGWWSYRYTLKRDPAKLEKIASEAKAWGDKQKARF